MSSLDQLIQLQNETEKELLKYEEKERAAELYEMTDNFDVDFFRNHDSKRRMLQNAQKKIMEKNRKKNTKSKVIYLVCKIRPYIITCLPKKLLDCCTFYCTFYNQIQKMQYFLLQPQDHFITPIILVTLIVGVCKYTVNVKLLENITFCLFSTLQGTSLISTALEFRSTPQHSILQLLYFQNKKQIIGRM